MISEGQKMSSRRDTYSLSLSIFVPQTSWILVTVLRFHLLWLHFHSYLILVTNTVSVTLCHFMKVTKLPLGSPSISFGFRTEVGESPSREGWDHRLHKVHFKHNIESKVSIANWRSRRSHDCFTSDMPERNQGGSPAVPGFGSLDCWGVES